MNLWLGLTMMPLSCAISALNIWFCLRCPWGDICFVGVWIHCPELPRYFFHGVRRMRKIPSRNLGASESTNGVDHGLEGAFFWKTHEETIYIDIQCFGHKAPWRCARRVWLKMNQGPVFHVKNLDVEDLLEGCLASFTHQRNNSAQQAKICVTIIQKHEWYVHEATTYRAPMS